jgi:enoyl-CoA hydratase/carnithine racemase
MATDTTTQAPVLSERRGAVTLITFNRPDRLNAWNAALEQAYFALLDEAEDDPEVRAIVVTGAGRGFCAGADMEDLSQIGDGTPGAISRQAGRSRDVHYRVRKPLIAAINGPAAGLGLVEALYCDIRFCTPGAKLTTSFARRGLIAEYGIAWLLPRLVGPSRATDLLFSGRVVLGEEALAIGLVDHLSEPDSVVEDAVAYAADLAATSSPTSMAIMKEQIRHAIGTDFDASFEEAGRLIMESFTRPDVKEGVASYLEKRPPAFPPLPARS